MKNALILFITCFSVMSFAQVGINTANPRTVFHIDGAKDNNISGPPSTAQQSNDYVVTSTGSVGIGTINPSTSLEINSGTVNGAIKIVDGSQGEGKVLTSDANGIGIWRNSAVSTITGVTATGVTSYGAAADKYMNSYIDLTQGKWFVFLGLLVNGATGANTRYASRFTLSSSTSTIEQVGFSFINNNKYVLTQVSNGGAGAYQFGMFSSGIIRVEVTSASQRIFIWDENSRTYGSVTGLSIANNGENYLFAIRAN